MRKPIAYVKDEPVLAGLFSEMELVHAHGMERKDFLQKQADKLSKEIQERSATIWSRIEGYCVERGYLSSDGYDKNKHSLEIDREVGVLLMRSKEQGGNSIMDLLSMLRDMHE